jgi:hypothetical protein
LIKRHCARSFKHVNSDHLCHGIRVGFAFANLRTLPAGHKIAGEAVGRGFISGAGRLTAAQAPDGHPKKNPETENRSGFVYCGPAKADPGIAQPEED